MMCRQAEAESSTDIAQNLKDNRYRDAVKSALTRTERLLKQRGASPIRMRFASKRNFLVSFGRPIEPFVLKDINESLSLTLRAGALYLGERPQGSKNLLREALVKYSSNPLAMLLLGDLFALEGSQGEATHYYIAFWDQVAGSNGQGLARWLFSDRDRTVVLEHVRRQLQTYGFEPPSRKPFPLSLTPTKITVAYVLPALIFLGIPFFIYRRLAGDEESSVSDRILYKIYFLLIFSYAVWLSHKLLHISPLIEPIEWEILGILAMGLVAVGVYEWVRRIWAHERERRDPETIFCPHCEKSILKLAVVCPFCNQKIDSESRTHS